MNTTLDLNTKNLNNMIIPDWPAPSSIGAAVTTKAGGCSRAPYEDFNLAMHVGDNPACVQSNRLDLLKLLDLPSEPAWLEQVHGTNVVNAKQASLSEMPLKADASYSADGSDVCVVMTADCLPILLCDTQGRQIAAVHAGWRGLANGIIGKTLEAFDDTSGSIIAWLGPAISQPYFEVGAELKTHFEKNNINNREVFGREAFGPSVRESHWYADLYCLAKNQLRASGVSAIYGGEYCTYSNSALSEKKRDSKRFFSYRRDGATGRMASLIWFKKTAN